MTKAGLYRTIRRVLDIDGWYLMATEYLECRQCKKKGDRTAEVPHSGQQCCSAVQHPAGATFRRLDAESDPVLSRSEQFLASCSVRVQFPPPSPQMPRLAADGVRLRRPDAAGRVQGQDHVHLRNHLEDGFNRPQLIYVDHDCCKRDGVSKTAALFQEWGQLVVRLDIWHLMRRFAAGVTTESHELYPTFMRQLSHCIFEVDPGDARRLTEAKRSQLEWKHGMVDLTDGEVIQRISREEWRLHCRRRTRGAEETALLIQDLQHLRRASRTRQPGHPVARRSPHPGHLEYADAPPQLHSGPTGRAAVHPDWQADKGRSQPAGLSLREGLHIAGVLPPQLVHPRDAS
ncbi:uncharacterized protein LOC122862245 [Siniperca chuatsi]|uniref:uncharacterized protein LOC122862245 n=1 Tax=Siniperca chuatsi TaxID=119488 RepID=UPI001CE1ACED|nr:uncharacterized protein LOC122862245 [Siniperca chuatsi]